jgi:hypothetical protein
MVSRISPSRAASIRGKSKSERLFQDFEASLEKRTLVWKMGHKCNKTICHACDKYRAMKLDPTGRHGHLHIAMPASPMPWRCADPAKVPLWTMLSEDPGPPAFLTAILGGITVHARRKPD